MKVAKNTSNLFLSLILIVLFIITIAIPDIPKANPVDAAQSCLWYCFRGNTKRTGVVKLDCGPQSKDLSFLWKSETIAQIKSSPIIVDSKVFFGSEDGKMHCLEQSTGRQLWETQVEEDIHSSPVYSSGNVYFGCDSGHFYCLDGETGDIEWTFKTEGAIHSSPVIYHQRIVFGSYDNFVYCLNLYDGKLKWKFETFGEVYSSPAVFDERVYIGSDDQTMYCLDFKSGEMIWHFETNKKIDATPVYTGFEVVFGCDSIYSLNSETGELNWEYPMGEFGVSSCAVAKSTVTVCRWDGMFFCLDLKTGKPKWSRIIDGFANAPSICDEVIYLSTNTGWFGSLSLRDGDIIWETDLGEPIKTSPAICDGLVIVGGDKGTVFCYGDELVRDCITTDVEVIDFGSVISRSDGQIQVNLINCGLNDVPVEYEIVGDWFSVKRFPSGAIPRRQRRHFFVYMLSQAIGLEKVYDGKLILRWADMTKEINVRVNVDNSEIDEESKCNWESYQSGNDGNAFIHKDCSPERDSLVTKYSVEFPDFLTSQPMVSGKNLIISRSSGALTCLDEFSGEKVWEFKTGSPLFMTPVVSGDKIYYTTENGRIGCIYLDDASMVWERHENSHPKTHIRVWKDYLYYVDEENTLNVISSYNGEYVGKFTPDGEVNHPPTIASAKVFFGTDTGILYCLSAEDVSELIWAKTFKSGITTPISYKKGNFCFGTENGVLYNINSNTGRTIWVKRLHSGLRGNISISDDSIFCVTDTNNLYSVSKKEGTINWNRGSWSRLIAGPTVSGNHVYISADTNIYMIAADSGHTLWSHDFIREIRSFSASAGKIFATCRDKNVYCLTSEPYIKFSPKILNFGSFKKAGKETVKLLVKNTTDKKVQVKLKSNVSWFKLSSSIFSLDAGEKKEITATTIQHKVNDPGIKNGLISADWGDDSATIKVWARVTKGEAYKNWSSFGADDKNSRANTESRLKPEKLKLDWSYKTNASILTSPVASNGRLYFGSNDSDLRCLDAEIGMLLWSFNTGKSIVSTGSIEGKYIFFGSEDGYVYCLDGSTGQTVWKFYTGGLVSSITSVVKSKKADIYFGSSNGKFYCLTYNLDESNFDVKWEKEYEHPIDCAPVIHTEFVYFATTDGKLLCLEKNSGDEVWDKDTGKTRSSPMIMDDKVLIQTPYDGIYCFNYRNGKRLWHNASIYGSTSFCSTGKDIIACGSNGWIGSIKTEDGEMNWVQDIQTPINSTPVTDGYSTFIADMDGKIRAFDVNSGTLKWEHDLEMPIISSPTIWNGRLYVGCTDSRIYAFTEK